MGTIQGLNGGSSTLPRTTISERSRDPPLGDGWAQWGESSDLGIIGLASLRPTRPTHLPRGIHFGECHLHFFFGHVQVKVLFPVFTDVRA